jgi:hypothetical protein
MYTHPVAPEEFDCTRWHFEGLFDQRRLLTGCDRQKRSPTDQREYAEVVEKLA